MSQHASEGELGQGPPRRILGRNFRHPVQLLAADRLRFRRFSLFEIVVTNLQQDCYIPVHQNVRLTNGGCQRLTICSGSFVIAFRPAQARALPRKRTPIAVELDPLVKHVERFVILQLLLKCAAEGEEHLVNFRLRVVRAGDLNLPFERGA